MAWKEETLARELHDALLLVIGPAGFLGGNETVGECMRDEDARAFMGHALMYEIMPQLPIGREAVDRATIAACGELDNVEKEEAVLPRLNDAFEKWRASVLPLILRAQEKDEPLPACLCMSLSLLIMLYAGLTPDGAGGYTLRREGGDARLLAAEDTLYAFSRLSCDMPPESLAYAVLSDRAIWARDLRDVDGLEEKIAGQLRDLQLLGLRAALRLATGVKVKEASAGIR